MIAIDSVGFPADVPTSVRMVRDADGLHIAFYCTQLETPGEGDSVGVTLYPGGKEFDDLVARRQKVQRQQNIDNARKFGVKNPEAIADAFEKALVKWRKLSKGIGRDVGKYEAALKREIYDKLDVTAL